MAPVTSRLQRRRNFFRRLRMYAYLSGGVLLVVGITYLVLGSPLFKISSLNIVGVAPEDQASLLTELRTQVIKQPLGWLGADHYFTWPTSLTYTAPLVASISIEKDFWARRITITALPRTRFAVWCNNPARDAECYWVDESGILFGHAPVAEGQLVQTIFDNASGSIGLIGEPVLTSSSFSVVKKIITEVKKLDIGVNTITIDRSFQELWLDTADGARISISLRFDPQPTALPAIARFAQKPGFKNIEYLNLTVENRAFVKYR